MTGPVPDLGNVAARLPARPRTRFAPSPTGWLHIGHVVNALYTWGIARALGGTVLLRIEDHDRERSRPEYERAILEDLAWLGLEPDHEGAPPLAYTRQSDRESVYVEALESLRQRGLVYACACSRKEIGQLTGETAGEPRYPGTCSDRDLPWQAGSGLRVRLDAGLERFEDGFLGAQVQDPASQSGDLLVRDRVGQWTYQFAVTVDDARQQIDLVIRGADLLTSTGRQIRLARLLGRTSPPVYLHHPLLYATTGVKLSKTNRDTGIRELREQGLSAKTVLGLAAAQANLIERPRPIAANELEDVVVGRLRGEGSGLRAQG